MKIQKKISYIINCNIKQNQNSFNKINSKKYEKLIYNAAQICIRSIKKKNKILFCGNGGSAADSQHLCAELVSKFLKVRKPYPAVALTTNTSIITSIGNDFGYDFIFSKQIESIGKRGDVLIAISTSGKSKNIIKAMSAAKKIGMKVIFFTGEKIFNRNFADIVIDAPANRVDRIQELHIYIGHTICEIIEKQIS
jgi:D-sedoheptulose 7-phosphate isomerase